MSSYLLIYGDIYWRTTFSFLDFIMENVMLDLNVLRLSGTLVFLKDSYSSDHYSISLLDSSFVYC
jgi:hypothetical protein